MVCSPVVMLVFPPFQKLESRISALDRTSSVSSEHKIKWKEVLVAAFMSSEESAEEVVDGVKYEFLSVKSLPWRCAKVNKFIKQLDEKIKKKKSKRGKQQTILRKPGSVSSRPKPTTLFDAGSEFWGFQ